jgi:hypothetical protein
MPHLGLVSGNPQDIDAKSGNDSSKTVEPSPKIAIHNP